MRERLDAFCIHRLHDLDHIDDARDVGCGALRLIGIELKRGKARKIGDVERFLCHGGELLRKVTSLAQVLNVEGEASQFSEMLGFKFNLM